MARTMQDLSEGVFISVANFTLAHRDSYLEHLHAGVMPRSHSGEGATMISANIEEQRRLQICRNSPKKSGKV